MRCWAGDVVVVFLNYTARRFLREVGNAYIAFRKGDKRKFRKYRKRAMEVVEDDSGSARGVPFVFDKQGR